MRKGGSRRFPIIRTLVLINAAAICGLYFYVVHHFTSQETAPALRLGAEYADTTEVELKTESQSLEDLARKTYEHDRELLLRAPPKDWDAIARAGALQIKEAWNQSEDKSWWKQPGYHLSYSEPDPQYPYQRIKYVDGKDTGIMMLAAPFYDTNYYRGEAARALFWRLKAKGHIMVGIMSYQEYPDQIVNPYDDRHVAPQDKAVHQAMDAWLHCSRDPDRVLPPGVPRLLISESDFPDPMRNDGGLSAGAGGVLIPDKSIPKQYDLVFSNQGGEWNDFARNWTLAKASVKKLVKELNLKVLVLGRNLSSEADSDLHEYIQSGQISVRPPGTPWRDFLKLMQTARAIFVPNIHDASPRVVTEAFCLDIPVVMNYHIVGGWKYVTEQTGEYFHDSRDVVEAFRRLRDPTRAAKLRPRQWFSENWGYNWSSYLLQAFMEAAVGLDRLTAVARDVAAFEANVQDFYDKERRRGELLAQEGIED